MTIDPQTGESRQILNALESAQAALNPLSGLLRAPRPKMGSYLDSVRDKVRSALALSDEHNPPPNPDSWRLVKRRPTP